VPGCKSNQLLKSGDTFGDSYFTYSFTDKLIVDFCVSGNCCPDENRFRTSSNILGDSIIVTVADTAQNLCKYICNYIIHGEFEQLPKDRYFIKCILADEENKQIICTEKVKRTLPI